MNSVETYLRDKYASKKWPFIGFIETVNICGYNTVEQLKLLKEKGMVRSREGMNGPLIEILDFETKWKQ